MKIRTLFVASAICIVAGAVFVQAQQPREVILRPYPIQDPPATVAKGGPVATPGPNDYYAFGEVRIPLLRSATECVVQLKSGTPEARQDFLGSLSPSVVIENEILTEGRAYQLLSIPADGSTALSGLLDQLTSNDAVKFVANVFIYPETGTRVLPTDEIVVKLRTGGTREELADVAATLGLTIVRTMWGTSDEFVLRFNEPKRADPLAKAQALHETGRFQWAEPNFIREYKKSAIPNDPRFGQQWHLNNTGQSGGTFGADVEASNAWDLHQGSAAITIAVVDDGVEKTHEDLAGNIFVNPGEIAGNGIDDDHNGYVDDVSGWDFSNGDNDASPFSVDDNHGTAVAGVAAGRGNNGIGVSGACQNCRILPVKIFSPNFAGDTAAGNAIRYAGSLADVINNSWGGGSPSSAIQSAIQSATTKGRGGKGSAVLFATGNSASGMTMISGPPLPAGTHRFRWTYLKDSSVSSGDDTTWLSWALFPGGQLVNFEGGLPAGWTTGGNSAWSTVTDPRHSDEGRCFTRAAKAGPLSDSQSNYLQVVKSLPAGSFYSYQWISSEEGFDGLLFEIDLDNNGSVDLATTLISGIPYVVSGVSYPAAHPESIAVGASSNFDCRSHYSQYGPELAFVAPSSAGPLNLGIETTDRTGSAGYDASNYTSAAGASGFGGTSSATPLASGIAGLLLSRNSSLTLSQIQTTMKNAADKVGPEPYVAGRNDRYGFGRLNAYQTLSSVSSCANILVSPATVPTGQTLNYYSQSLVASGGTAAYTFAVTVGSLPPGLTLSASGLLSGTPNSAGTYNFSVRATDANGCSGYRAFNMLVIVGPTPTGTSLYIVTPCRVVDTRGPAGPSGGPALANLATRDLQMSGVCGIPSSAKAVVANVTAVSPATTGFLSLFPTGSTWPGNSTINYRTGKTRANNTILRLSASGMSTILNNGSTQHFIIDVTGYFE